MKWLALFHAARNVADLQTREDRRPVCLTIHVNLMFVVGGLLAAGLFTDSWTVRLCVMALLASVAVFNSLLGRVPDDPGKAAEEPADAKKVVA